MILVDTGPLLALLDQNDQRHADVVAWLESGLGAESLVVPSTVIAELQYFVARRLGTGTEAAFLRALGNGRYGLEDPTLPDYLRAADLVEQYGDFPLGTVDAVIVAMAERLNVRTILTLDERHFRAVKPQHCERFQLAP